MSCRSGFSKTVLLLLLTGCKGSDGGVRSSDGGTIAADPDGATPADSGADMPAPEVAPSSSSRRPGDPIPVGQWPARRHSKAVVYDDRGKLHLVDFNDPGGGWSVDLGGEGRDLQLIGNNAVMVGMAGGWAEHELERGGRIRRINDAGTSDSVQRLPNGNTLVASASKDGISLREIEVAAGKSVAKRTIRYPGFTYVRLVRWTDRGTFLVTADTEVFEGDDTGKVLWRLPIKDGGHVWKALPLPDGGLAVTSGYGHSLVVFDPMRNARFSVGDASWPETLELANGVLVKDVFPKFFADVRLLPSGNFLVVNSRVHMDDADKSIQLLELDPAGKLVWYYKQQPARHEQFEAVIILDGLDTGKLHHEPQGRLVPVN